MPWPTEAPVYNFNYFSIMLNAAPEYGIYAVFNAQHELILVGCGEVMQDLTRLCRCGGREFMRAQPALFSFMRAPVEMANRLKEQLRRELLPEDNARAAGE